MPPWAPFVAVRLRELVQLGDLDNVFELLEHLTRLTVVTVDVDGRLGCPAAAARAEYIRSAAFELRLPRRVQHYQKHRQEIEAREVGRRDWWLEGDERWRRN